LESVLNVPVRLLGTTIRTMNLLHRRQADVISLGGADEETAARRQPSDGQTD
jgi:hypothetical protein